ncbi:hypothetical protein G7Y89_g11342 [Cudoniella acicularis]|uniref:N-acetyltransferase domain-containing protein n=1 Tax=Cudoniella acicularis TaxID=354080 RepID=A0A8H4RDE8_9HELO|nr:hypothetical protein G7Y89_g11342 [Cudoniella acicularis]
MATPNISIHPLLPSDLPKHASLLLSSKLALSINRLLFKNWPNEPFQLANYTKAAESGFNDKDSETWKVIDDGTEEIVGHFVLSRKRGEDVGVGEGKEGEEEKGEGEKGKKDIKVPEGFNEEVFKAVVKLAPKMDTLIGVDHFVITHVYIQPLYRRRGIGSQLIHMAIEKSEKEGIPLSVGVEPEAHEFFLKMGFKDRTLGDMDLSAWAPAFSGYGVFRLWGMVFEK